LKKLDLNDLVIERAKVRCSTQYLAVAVRSGDPDPEQWIKQGGGVFFGVWLHHIYKENPSALFFWG